MMIFNYKSKKVMKESIGKPLDYTETSMFGPEYKNDGVLYGSNRPQLTNNGGREFYAQVTMKDGMIHAVK